MIKTLTKYNCIMPKHSPERFKVFYLGLAFVCLVVMLAVSILVIQRHSHKALIAYVETTAEKISDSIYYTEVDAILLDTFNGKSSIYIPSSSFDYLDTRIRDKYDQLDILRISIYNINSTIIYSSDKKSIGQIDHDPLLATCLQNGTMQTLYERHQTIVDLLGEKRQNIDLAEVYVPLKHKNGQIIGVIQVVTDVAKLQSDSMRRLYSSIIVLACSILVISLLSYIVIIRETDELKRAYDLLESLATTDSLTGVRNRRQLLSQAEQLFAMTRRSGSRVSPGVGLGCIMIDLDFFKQVNDTYGHLVGDAVLCDFAARITAILRQYDIFGRYGGEEFLLFLPTVTEEEVVQVATRVCNLIHQQPFENGEVTVQITISIGATWTDAAQGTLDSILMRMDALLYEAKNKGRNQVVFGL